MPLFPILLLRRFKPTRIAGDGAAVSALMVPDTRRRAAERLLDAIRVLDRLWAEPTARGRLEAVLGAELTHRLLADTTVGASCR
jgi:hypothetical protein